MAHKGGKDSIVLIEKMNNLNRFSINLVESEEEEFIRKKGIKNL